MQRWKEPFTSPGAAGRGGLGEQGWGALSRDAPLRRNSWDVPGSFFRRAAGWARTTVCGHRVSLPLSERFPVLEARRALAGAGGGCSGQGGCFTPDTAPALAVGISVPGLWGQVMKQGRWQLKPQFVNEGSENEAGKNRGSSLPRAGGRRAYCWAWLLPPSRDGKATASRISAGTSPGRNDVPLEWARGCLLLSPLGQRDWCGLKRALLLISASGSDTQHLHGA